MEILTPEEICKVVCDQVSGNDAIELCIQEGVCMGFEEFYKPLAQAQLLKDQEHKVKAQKEAYDKGYDDGVNYEQNLTQGKIKAEKLKILEEIEKADVLDNRPCGELIKICDTKGSWATNNGCWKDDCPHRRWMVFKLQQLKGVQRDGHITL